MTRTTNLLDPGRFGRSRDIGAYLGLTPRRHQSGGKDVSGMISKQGDGMSLKALIEKAPDADLLREMIGFAAERLMALEVDALCGASHGERSAERTNMRNG